MIFGVTRSVYNSAARFKVGGPVDVIRWYFAPEGAEIYPHSNIFFPLNQTLQYRPTTGVGELALGSRLWRRGDPPPTVEGLEAHGTQADFLGQTLYEGPVPISEVPGCRLPLCIELGAERSNQTITGGIELGGYRRNPRHGGPIALGARRLTRYYRIGGIELGGLPRVAFTPAHIGLGGFHTSAGLTGTHPTAGGIELGGFTLPPPVIPRVVCIELGGFSVSVGSARRIGGIELGGPADEVSPTSGPIELGGHQRNAGRWRARGGIELAGHTRNAYRWQSRGGVELGGHLVDPYLHRIRTGIELGGDWFVGPVHSEMEPIELGGIVPDPGPCALCEWHPPPLHLEVEVSCPDLPDVDGLVVTLDLVRPTPTNCYYFGTLAVESGGNIAFTVSRWVFDPTHVVVAGTYQIDVDEYYTIEGAHGDDYACDPFAFAGDSELFHNIEHDLMPFLMTLSVTQP